MKRMVSLILVLMLVLSLPAFAVADETPVITIAVQDKVNVEDFNTNLETLMIEEELGVDIQFEVYPETDYNEKINTMIMAGGAELPDVLFVTPTDAQLLNWIGSDCIIPLTEYYNDPEISKHIHEDYDLLGVDFSKMMIQYDGEIYAIPTFNQSYGNEYPHKAFYNMKWLEALETTAPTTPDELYDLLVKVKNTDLNGNGKNDEIGMVGNMIAAYYGWFSYIMNAFVYSDNSPEFFAVEDGTVYASFATEAWKEGLKFMRKLFAEELIPKEVLTQDDTQFLAMLNSEECTTMMFFYTSPSRVNTALAWRNDFEAVPPLINQKTGKPQTAFRPSSPSNGAFFITKNCKYPELAFKIGDLIVSEYYSIMTRWGQEGVDWDYAENVPDADKYVAWADGFDKLLLAYDDAKFWSSGEIQNRTFLQRGPYIRRYGVANGRMKDPATSSEFDLHINAGDNLYQIEAYRPEELLLKLVYSEEEMETVADVLPTLKQFRDEWTANVLAGNTDIDADWDNYLNELNNIGLEELINVYQTVYDRMYK